MTRKLRFYLLLLAAAGVLLYLAPYFIPLIKGLVEPLTGPVKEAATYHGLNPNAFVVVIVLTIAFLFILVVTMLAGRELEKHTLRFLHKTIKK